MASGFNSAVEDVLTAEIEVSVSPERVFQALADPQQVTQWWGGQGAGQAFRCTEFEADLRVGGKWRSAGTIGGGQRFEVTGEYLEIDPPRALVYSWVASWTGLAKTKVSWELIPVPNGTLVKLRHSGLAAHPEIANAYRGWARMLGWLQAFVDTGETAAKRFAQ